MNSKPTENSPRRQRYLKWRRRLGRILIVVVLLLICFRALLAVLLPVTLNKVAGFYGLECDYSRLKLSVLGGYASVWDLKLLPKGGGEPIATVYHAGGDISTWDLLRAKLSIWRLEASDIDVQVERLGDGSIPLLQRLAQSSQKSQEVKQQKRTAGELDFSSPLSVEAISLGRLRLHVRDELVKPAFAGTLEISLQVEHLGALDRSTAFAISMRSPEAPYILDELRLAGNLRGEGRRLSANARLKAWGLRPGPAAAYLEAMGLRPAAESLELDGELNLVTQPVDVAPDAVQAHLGLRGLRLSVDHQTAMGLRDCTVDAPFLSAHRLDLGRIAISGVEVAVSRSSAGLLRAAGLELLAAAKPATQPVASHPAAATRPAVAATTTSPVQMPALFQASVDELLIKDVTARFRDDTAGTQLELRLDELRGSNWATYPRDPAHPADLKLAFGLPGIASRVTLAMSVDPFAGTKAGKMQLEMTGLKLDALAPYLAAAGLASEYRSGTLRAELEGSFQQQPNGWLKGDVRLKDLALLDREQLLRWDNAAVRGLAVDPRSFELSIDAIELVGPKLQTQRDAGGAIHLLGLRTTTAPAAVAAVPVAQPATMPAAAEMVLPIPRLSIGKFSWTGISAQMQDFAVSPAATLELSDAGIVVEKIVLDRDPAAGPHEPSPLRAWMCAPGIADRVEVTGSIAPTLRQAKLELKLQGDGLSLARLAPYTVPVGIRPVLKQGAVHAALAAFFEKQGDGGRGWLTLSDVALTDGKEELAGLGNLSVQVLDAQETGARLGEVSVKSPRIHVTRQPSGDLALLGMQLEQATAKPKAASAPAAAASAPAPAATAPARAGTPLVVTLERLVVEEAQARWTDLSVQPQVDWRATTQVKLENLCIGKDAPPAKLHISSVLPGVIEQTLVDGTLRTAPDAQDVNLSLSAQGIRGMAFDPYLPPALRGNLKSGTSSAKLLASHRMVPGADEISAEVRDFSLRDGGVTLIGFTSGGAQGVRLSEDVQVASLFLKGASLRLQRTPEGEFAVAGLRTQTQASPQGKPATRPSGAAAGTRPAPHQDADVLALVTAARKAAPLVEVNRVEVGVDEIRFSDAARPAARDLVIRNLMVSNDGKPLRVLGKDPFAQPACDLRLTFAVEDLVKQVEVKLSALPFAATPSAKTTLDITGIHGDRLTEFVPEMKGIVDGTPLQNAAAHAELEASAKIERRGAAAFDFRRDFSLYATLRDVRFEMPGQPTLLGVESIAFPEIQVHPGNQQVVIPSLEITRPIAHAYREKDGFYVAGLRITPPAAATQPAQKPKTEREAAPAQAAVTAAAPAADKSDGEGELLIRKLTISGLDVSFEDRSVQPAVVVPLTGLEFEAFDLSSQATTARKPLRFSGLLYAGRESLPQRKGPPTTRPVFTQISTSGQLTLYPQPQGWVKTSVNGFELVTVAPLAKPFGIEITSGLNDVDVDLRIKSRADADLNMRLLVNDLGLSENENGPIYRTLKLPAPTSAVIGLLEDVDGSITLPLSIPVREGTVSGSSIAASALSATSRVIATAVASAPVKLVAGLTGGGKKKVAKESRLELHFAAGDSELRAGEREALMKAMEPYRFDRQAELTITHQLGKNDLALASQRVNPGEEDASALVNQLRATRQRLVDRRRELEARARAELAMYSPLSSQKSVAEVQRACRDLAQTEDALDRVLELFRPGAAGQAPRRTRAAAIELGERRLASVENAIGAAHVGTLASRTTKTAARFAVAEDVGDSTVVVTIVSRQR